MKLSVIIVSYRVPYYVEQCIRSVRQATKDIDCEIIVVDNHSNDGTVDYLTKCFGSSITLIDSNHNLGFARANNLAIKQSQGEYVLLLNPDTFVGTDAISQVVSFMDEHPKAGGVGCRMHNANGTLAMESRRGLPTPYVSFLKMLGVDRTAVIVQKDVDDTVVLAMSNLPRIDYSTAQALDVYAVLANRKLVCDKAAFDALMARIAR